MAKHEPAVVMMEACGSASYWAREMVKLGHEVRLIAPQYVRPFVKRQKSDAADAEAIVVAAQRPEMRFVEPKSEDQQACAVLFRARERLLHQRTELVNALRSVLYEYGHVFPKDIAHLRRIEAVLSDPASDLPALVRDECHDLLEQISEQTARIEPRQQRPGVLPGRMIQRGGCRRGPAWGCRPRWPSAASLRPWTASSGDAILRRGSALCRANTALAGRNALGASRKLARLTSDIF